jgi:hypothetical protein
MFEDSIERWKNETGQDQETADAVLGVMVIYRKMNNVTPENVYKRIKEETGDANLAHYAAEYIRWLFGTLPPNI